MLLYQWPVLGVSLGTGFLQITISLWKQPDEILLLRSLKKSYIFQHSHLEYVWYFFIFAVFIDSISASSCLQNADALWVCLFPLYFACYFSSSFLSKSNYLSPFITTHSQVNLFKEVSENNNLGFTAEPAKAVLQQLHKNAAYAVCRVYRQTAQHMQHWSARA